MLEGIIFTIIDIVIIPFMAYYETTDFDVQVISSLIFLGLGVGSFSLGYLTKYVGRLLVLKTGIILLIVTTLLMIFIKSIIVMCFVRILSGIALAFITPVSLNIFCEYLPIKNRSFALILVWQFFAFGMLVNVIIILLVMPNFEVKELQMVFVWIFIVILIVSMYFFIFVEDSPRNLILEGKINQGIAIYEKMLRRINVPMTKELRAHIIEYMSLGDNRFVEPSLGSLFEKKFLLITILNIIIWFLSSALFYGNLLIFNKTLKLLGNASSSGILTSNFISIFVSFAGLFIGAWLSEIQSIGLKYSSMIYYTIALIFACLIVSITSEISLFNSFFQAFGGNAFQMSLTFANIVYPTKIRDMALGFFYFCCRAGAFISQFLFYGLFLITPLLPYYLMIGILVVLIFSVFLIPVDVSSTPLDREFSEYDDLVSKIHKDDGSELVLEMKEKVDFNTNDNTKIDNTGNTNNDNNADINVGLDKDEKIYLLN